MSVGIIICSMLDLFARKKIMVNFSYLIGTVIFVTLSYSTTRKEMVSAPMHLFSTNRIANKLPSSAVVVQPLPSMLVKSTTPIANVSLGPLYSYRADRKQMLETGCSQPNIPSVYALPNLIRDSEMLNHLGFILQSHSLFYCSVPKVATRTFLMFLTYLHLRDELMAPVKPNSRSPSFKADHLYQVLPPSSKVNRKLFMLTHSGQKYAESIQSIFICEAVE